MNILTQAIGIAAMAFNILSYQCKNAKRIIFMQLVGSLLFAVNFLMLGSILGAMMNIAGVVRALIFVKWKNPHWILVPAFLAAFVTFYILTFTVFDKEPTVINLLLEATTVIGMSATTFGFYSGKERTIRLSGYINSPMWLLYNAVTGSIGGVLCESFALVSITVGLVRYRKLKFF